MSKPTGDEQTFRSYSKDDAAKYAQHRQQYSDALYDDVLSHHTSTGGALETVLDLGCGPGLATFRLARSFTKTIGLDPSEGMIAVARSLAESSPDKAEQAVKFDVSTSEDISPALIPDSSVDLITAATCAHWFDMSRFWPTAARILKPGGSVAIWSSKAANIHSPLPTAVDIDGALREIENQELLPYFAPGNLLVRDLYANIGLPWTIDPPETSFVESAFVRKLFGTGPAEPSFFDTDPDKLFDMDTFERIIATVSPVTRWRQAHPEKVGTEDDVVRRMRRTIEKLLHEAGVEEGKEMVKGTAAGVLLVIKKQV